MGDVIHEFYKLLSMLSEITQFVEQNEKFKGVACPSAG
jgi:hypothetical protein